MGDFIQKTPMIRSIVELDHSAEIFLIGDNRWQGLELVKGSPLIKEVCNLVELLGLKIPLGHTNTEISKIYEYLSRSQKKRLRSWLKAIEWDVFYYSTESDVPPKVFDIINRSGKGIIYSHFTIKERKLPKVIELFTRKNRSTICKTVPICQNRHDIDLNYDLLTASVSSALTRTYGTWVSIGSQVCQSNEWNLSKHQYICLQPGAANGTSTPKTWHPRNFVDLSTRLSNELGLKIVLLGDHGDQEHIISKWDWPEDIINTAGKTSIGDLYSLIKNAACVVAHDSGIMHLANAMEIPLVALFGPTDYIRNRPLGKKSRILYSRTQAFAIMRKCDKSEEKLAEEFPDNEAMSGISVSEVQNMVKSICQEHALI